jgi:hypothetical protein
MKKNDKILTRFGDATYQKYIFLAARGVQLDNGLTPWKLFKTIYKLWILWRNNKNIKNFYQKSQAIYVDKMFKKNLHILEDITSGVQVGDIEEVTSKIHLKYHGKIYIFSRFL